MRRLGDMLPGIAAGLGIEAELRLARQMAAWERLISERIPGAAGASHLLSVQPPALVVSASQPERRPGTAPAPGRAADGVCAELPEGVRLLELRVVVRPPRSADQTSGRRGGPR